MKYNKAGRMYLSWQATDIGHEPCSKLIQSASENHEVSRTRQVRVLRYNKSKQDYFQTSQQTITITSKPQGKAIFGRHEKNHGWNSSCLCDVQSNSPRILPVLCESSSDRPWVEEGAKPSKEVLVKPGTKEPRRERCESHGLMKC